MSIAASNPCTPYEEHRSYVLGVVAGRCTWVPRADREAVYHEAYVAMLELESAGRLDTAAMHPRQLRAYLAKAAVRKALDDRKRAEYRLTVPLGPVAENRPDPGRPVDERVASVLDARTVTELVSELPSRQRAVLQLRFAIELEPAEIQCALGISARVYRRDLERALRHVAARYELVREGRWCESRRSLVLAYVAGIAGPRKAHAARSHLAACPGCARMAGDLRRASQQAAAVLPVPDVLSRDGTFHRIADVVSSARDGVAYLVGGAKQHGVAVATRASDPTPLAGARPGAAAAAIAGCLAIGGGATYCAVEGLPDPLRDSLGIEHRSVDRAPTVSKEPTKRARATQVEEPTHVVAAPPAQPDTEQAAPPAPPPPVPTPPPPEPPSEAQAAQANQEFGIEQSQPTNDGGEFGAAPRTAGAASPGGEFSP